MSETPAQSRTSRRRRWMVAGALIVLLVGVLAVLAVPFLRVPGEARAARQSLEVVVSALRAGDPRAAARAAADAREHVDTAQDATQGTGGDIWSRIPFAGSPVSDARHLTQALDDVTDALETAVELYPSVAGNRATLFRDGQVDGGTLSKVVAGIGSMGDRLASAKGELDAVDGGFPVIGRTIASNQEQASAVVDPMAETFAQARPMVDQLPSILGFDGNRSYLVAMLNPAELRYSGGAALAFAPMSFDEGAITLGDSRTVAGDPALKTEARWRRVRGNTFHAQQGTVMNSTFAPSWSVSGEELLRAWGATHGKRHDGVVAIDVEALAGLLGTTDGAEVPGYGTLTGANLVQALIGSYDRYYPDPNAQDDLNNRLIPVFKDLMFEGGNYAAKARALGQAADGRHFALYLRSPDGQAGVEALGLAGDLAPPQNDYAAVFTQNINGSKADYWQKRAVSLEVDLSKDGSSRNTLSTTVFNDSPTYSLPVPDPRVGYFTRFAVINLAAVLPGDATVIESSTDGEPWEVQERGFREHAYATTRLNLDPGATARGSLTYQVPSAATPQGDDTLLYRLAADPQGTVVPESLDVQVRMPKGYRARALPDGWSTNGRVLRFRTDALEVTQEWTIPLDRAT